MREKPILFSAPMVRAILEGRKTQTRRIVKKQFDADAVVRECCNIIKPEGWQGSGHSGLWAHGGDYEEHPRPCPYGIPGDRLWVKETHARVHPGLLQHLDPDPNSPHWGTLFRADGVSDSYLSDYGEKWKPSIFMRREYSRITLEITGVRVERLQDISEEDVKAEGVEWNPGTYDGQRFYRHYGAGCNPGYLRPSESYRTLWESINGAGSWDLNPWVWVIEFKPLTPPQKAEKE